jgi:hypothetical protein
MLLTLISYSEIARCYGSDCNIKAVQNLYHRYLKEEGKRVHDTLKAGRDPKDLPLLWSLKDKNGCFHSPPYFISLVHSEIDFLFMSIC